MTEAIQTETPAVKAPVKRRKRKVRKARAAAPSSTAAKPVKTSDELSGISATSCPAACTAERCVISTVGVCKHPFKSGDGGCGPVTMANRARAKKLIKHQVIEARE